MAQSDRTERLAGYQARYAQLAGQLADVGLIAAGSITQRYTRCSAPGCRCNADPPQPHGPYYQWTAKVNGKTVTRRLSRTRPALPGVDRQRPTTTQDDHQNARSRRQSHRTDDHQSQQGQGLIAS